MSEKVYRLGEIMKPCSSSVFKDKPERVRKIRVGKAPIEERKVENVHALLADKEVREKLSEGWRLKVVRTGKVQPNYREEGSLFLSESTIEGLRTMENGRLVGISHRLTHGEEFVDIWTVIPPEVK